MADARGLKELRLKLLVEACKSKGFDAKDPRINALVRDGLRPLGFDARTVAAYTDAVRGMLEA